MNTDEHPKDPVPEYPDGEDADPSASVLQLRPERAPQLRTPRGAGVAGIIFTLLLVTSIWLLGSAPGDLNDAETVAWLKEHATSTVVVVGLYLMPFAGMAFLWFTAVVRDRIGRFEDRFFSTAFLGTGLLFIAMIFAGTAAVGSLVVGIRYFGWTDYPNADVIRSVGTLAYTFTYVYGVKMAGAFVLVTNTIAFRTRIFSRWVALVGYVTGLILLLNFGIADQRLLSVVFPAWVLFLSVYILITAPKVEVDDQGTEL